MVRCIVFGVGNLFGDVNELDVHLLVRVALIVPPEFQPESHCYGNYAGPWIERYFYTTFKQNGWKFDRLYLPIFWTDYYWEHGFDHPHAAIGQYLAQHLQADQSYFTIVQNDDGILENLPENVLVFGAGGEGDIPIPLLNANLSGQRHEKSRDHLASFVGLIEGPSDRTGLRRTIYEALKDHKDYVFAKSSYGQFIKAANHSIFTLCPRGYGRTSFRLYEAMALGSIPVYIWDDRPWLPYQDVLDWSEFSVCLNIDQIGDLPNILENHTELEIRAKQEKILEIFDQYFTMEGTCRQIKRMLETES